MGVATDKEELSRAIHNPGRLVLGPTTLAGVFPYGGVSLGLHCDEDIVWHEDYVHRRDVGSGAIAEVGRRGICYPEIYCLLLGVSWDEDACIALFQKATRMGDPVETFIGGSNTPSLVSAWPPLLFVAHDPMHKSVYIRRPIPTLSLRHATAISMDRRSGLPLRFIPTIDSSAPNPPHWQIARLENITL